MSEDDGKLIMFCKFCENASRILGSGKRNAVDIPHHESYSAFLKSAEACQLCSLVVKQLQTFGEKILEIQCRCSTELSIEVKYLYWQNGSHYVSPMTFYYELFRDRDRPSDAQGAVFGRNILKDPAEAFVSVAIPWITDCQNNHPKCRQIGIRHLPTRVLDVGDDGDDVILRKSKDLSGSYTILSHCWGKQRISTTTAATISQRMVNIPYTELPATFRDAVRITRLLGIRYLWIDSLCIVQDQLSDWEHESARMHEYYKNSFITIAALDSENSFAGMLHQRQMSSVQLPGFENLSLRLGLPAARVIYENSILESRAWCLQERLLSSRVIHIANSEFLWECRTGHRRESSDQEGDVMPIGYPYQFGPERLKRILDNLETDPLRAEKAPEFWYHLLGQYSGRDLTNPKDMLPAILGVAKQIQEYTGLTLIYGIWKEDFHKGLLWRISPRESLLGCKRQNTGAPSWSWASMTGEKHWVCPNWSPLEKAVVFSEVIAVADHELVLRSRHVRVSLPQDCTDGIDSESRDPVEMGLDATNLVDALLWSKDNALQENVGWMTLDDNRIDARPFFGVRALEIFWNCSSTRYFLLIVPHPEITGSWKRIGIGMSASLDIHGVKSAFEGADYEFISLL
ncbi:hypothetical protein VTL71DRAFT_11439 [Oculimacula yallundae]|uniref:Heterokaryon incompatibility domain-containing protein n=1 Tax=Oculimacula yallundae TaxID=86028 RepID=A0ABR4CRT7_9HELO